MSDHPLCGTAQQQPGKFPSCRAPDNDQVWSKYFCLTQDLIVGNADLDLGHTGCSGRFKFLTFGFQMMQRLFPSELKFRFVLFGFKSSQASFGSWNLNNGGEILFSLGHFRIFRGLR
jgi:hypothetical protein